jgi:hypothetical protein
MLVLSAHARRLTDTAVNSEKFGAYFVLFEYIFVYLRLVNTFDSYDQKEGMENLPRPTAPQ